MRQIIKSVNPGSIGEELGFEPGDSLLGIDGQVIEDVLDYYYYCEKETLTLQILTKDGEEVECVVEKDEDEDLGLVFEEEFMGHYRRCSNQCMFCFIDQMPKGMRESLYFKDDDSRLSFLNGNYITMTNMSEEDFEKIIRYQMSPINISVQVTDPDLRVMMLKNRRAVNLMPRMRRLKEAGIRMNGQIVLCKGVNDGRILDQTIRDLAELKPELQSVSIVPVGLSKYREGLYPLEPFTKEELAAVIDQVEPYRERFYAESGMHFMHLSDEFYIGAERPIPPEDAYDGYLQLENGVGMMRLFLDETEQAISGLDPSRRIEGHVSLVSAVAAGPFIRQTCEKIMNIGIGTTMSNFMAQDEKGNNSDEVLLKAALMAQVACGYDSSRLDTLQNIFDRTTTEANNTLYYDGFVFALSTQEDITNSKNNVMLFRVFPITEQLKKDWKLQEYKE